MDAIPAEGSPTVRSAQAAREGAASHQGGLGIGLYICQLIVELHGGQLQVVQRGDVITFRVGVPAAAEA